MFAIKPTAIVKGVLDHDTVLPQMQVARIESLRKSHGSAIPAEYYDEVITLVSDQCGITFTNQQLDEVFFYFPDVKATLMEFGTDTATMGMVYNALATFYVGSTWPTYGDCQEKIGIVELTHDEYMEKWLAVFVGQVNKLS